MLDTGSSHWGCTDGWAVWGIATDCYWGHALMAERSGALPLAGHCLSPLRACPDGWVVWDIATTCSLSLIPEGLPRWLSALRHCHWLLAVSDHWGASLMAEQSRALSLSARCLSPLRALRHCHWLLAVSHHWGLWGIVTDCSLSLITEGLPRWLSGMRHCHWLLGVSHRWGHALMAERSEALPLTARCLSSLRACPDG